MSSRWVTLITLSICTYCCKLVVTFWNWFILSPLSSLWRRITNYVMVACYIFLYNFLENTSPFCGATNAPVLHFWWRLPLVAKPGWITYLYASLHACDGFLRFTSGAICRSLFYIFKKSYIKELSQLPDNWFVAVLVSLTALPSMCNWSSSFILFAFRSTLVSVELHTFTSISPVVDLFWRCVKCVSKMKSLSSNNSDQSSTI